jgi:tetratricopeptide (TPR) repeat protein
MSGERRISLTGKLGTLLSCGALAGALACPASLRGQGSGVNTIRGKVAGPDGRPVAVQVQLKNQAGYVVDTVYTNSEGEFTFQAVYDGVYHVIVDDPHYRPAEASARVAASIYPMASVFISLESRLKPPPKPAGYSGDAQSVSVHQLEAKFPKPAVKEYEKGNKKMEQGDLEGAIKCFKKAVAIAPGMTPALNNLGIAYLETHRMGEADAMFRKAMAADPDAPDSYINLGHVYYELRKYDQAKKFLAEGLKRDPAAALAYFFLGLMAVRTGETRVGEVDLQKALDLNDPRVVSAHLILADLYLKTHRISEARLQLQSFLKIRPQDPQAGHIREVLERLKAESNQ